ncbi:ABC transporter permease [uncultured Sphaerochaeta sp.]|uniref:ABC transporter permease subunit n=1 Tax=uncultured Sphaerochaeta sp. TaxID=886478 RepID=UPI002A0A116B|nr:ABC transporter permease [uncultured Sphaerochaeta sp.]
MHNKNIEKMTGVIKNFGLPRIIILCFLLLLNILMAIKDIPVGLTISQCLVRIGINLILSLAMMPGIMAGTGMNFALPIGIECGLLAGMISLQYNIVGFSGLFFAIICSIPMSIIAGYCYSLLLNRVRGNEMMVSTYTGFSIVALMCLVWLVLPFDNPGIVWPMGKGIRTTITLDAWYDRILNNLWSFSIFGIEIPTGLLLFAAFFCVLMWVFKKSRLGLMMIGAGSNPKYAIANGVDVNRMRTLSVILSTVLGGIGIIIYAQGFSFYQLYNAPLMMAFPAVAAVLIGGATTNKISIFNVVLGTIMFQSLLAIAVPVANSLIPEGNISEVVRTIVSNGIILYALSQMKNKDR